MPSTINAPYAANPIPLHLGSSTGMRYRTLNCMECGREFLERNNDTLYRSNDQGQPPQAISSTPIPAVCGYCSQQYILTIAIQVTIERYAVPLHQQPQSVYIAPETSKQQRTIHCLECGKVFQGISDRISQVVDNQIPMQYVVASHLGPVTAMCSFKKCKQAWAFIL